MIVRDEAPVIARALRSVRPFVTSYAIVDTGSTDDTIGIIRQELAGIPGVVSCRTWPDRFDTARNWALDIALKRGAERFLSWNASDELVLEGDPLPLPPLGDATLGLRFEGSEPAHPKVWIAPVSSQIRWKGVVHEVPEPAAPQTIVFPDNLHAVIHDDGSGDAAGFEAKQRRYLRMCRIATSDPGASSYDFYAHARVAATVLEWEDAVWAANALLTHDNFAPLGLERAREIARIGQEHLTYCSPLRARLLASGALRTSRRDTP